MEIFGAENSNFKAKLYLSLPPSVFFSQMLGTYIVEKTKSNKYRFKQYDNRKQ